MAVEDVMKPHWYDGEERKGLPNLGNITQLTVYYVQIYVQRDGWRRPECSDAITLPAGYGRRRGTFRCHFQMDSRFSFVPAPCFCP